MGGPGCQHHNPQASTENSVAKPSSDSGTTIGSIVDVAADLCASAVSRLGNFAADCSRLREIRERHLDNQQTPEKQADKTPEIGVGITSAYSSIALAVSSAVTWAANFSWGQNSTTGQTASVDRDSTETSESSILSVVAQYGQSLSSNFNQLLKTISVDLENLKSVDCPATAAKGFKQIKESILEYKGEIDQKQRQLDALAGQTDALRTEFFTDLAKELRELRERVEILNKSVESQVGDNIQAVRLCNNPEFEQALCEHGQFYRHQVGEQVNPIISEIASLERDLADGRISPENCCQRIRSLRQKLNEQVSPFVLQQSQQFSDAVQQSGVKFGVSSELLSNLRSINQNYYQQHLNAIEQIDISFETTNLALTRYKTALAEQWTPGNVNGEYGVSNLWFYPELKKLLEETKIRFLTIADAVESVGFAENTVLNQAEKQGFARWEMDSVVEGRRGLFCGSILEINSSSQRSIRENEQLKETLEQRGERLASNLKGEISAADRLRAETIEA